MPHKTITFYVDSKKDMDAKGNELAKGSTTTISTKPKKGAAHTTTKGITNEYYSLFIKNLLQNQLIKQLLTQLFLPVRLPRRKEKCLQYRFKPAILLQKKFSKNKMTMKFRN